MGLLRFLILLLSLGQALHAKTYTVGVQDFFEYSPYSTYQNEKYTGFNKIILDMFAKKMNITFEYKAYPIKRLIHNFLDEDLDFKYPDNPNWVKTIKGDRKIYYSEPLVKHIDAVIIHKKNLGKGSEAIKTLGIVRGFSPWVYMDKIKSGEIKKQENGSISGLLLQINDDRVDGGYFNVAVFSHYRNLLHEDIQKNLIVDYNLPFSKGTRHLASIKHPQLILKFNKFLEDNKTEIDKLKKKYNVEKGLRE